MTYQPSIPPTESWLAQLFSSFEARNGGVVDSDVRDVEQMIGREAFAREVVRRGFQAIENGGRFIVFCNDRPIRRVRVGMMEHA